MSSVSCLEASRSKCRVDILPGEEVLHDRLQRELIDILIRLHRHCGLVVQLEAKIGHRGSKKGGKGGLRGMIRSIEAAPGRYSCEFVELSPTDGSPLDNRFFTLVSPEEEQSRASILVLAKAAALIDSPDVRHLGEGQFNAVVGQGV